VQLLLPKAPKEKRKTLPDAMANSARDNILAAVKSALAHPRDQAPAKPDLMSPLYVREKGKDPVLVFAENFSARKSSFFYSESMEEFRQQITAYLAERKFRQVHIWEKELADELSTCHIQAVSGDRNLVDIDCGITLCECLVERTGSILVSSRQGAGRRLSIYPPVHIVVASVSQILPDIKDALSFMKKKYGQRLPSMMSMITGASRTADIEKTLVMGAHGPKELILFLIDDAEA
jgi:L-lactate dehydrogenase complex protein LldG